MYSKKSLELLKKYDEKSSSEKTGLITNETRANAERARTEAETKRKKAVSPTFLEDLERVKDRDKNAQILPKSNVKRVYSKAGTTPAETLGHSIGYTAETALAGALGALEDVGDFGLSVLESLGYGISSLGGLKQNAVSDKFKEWFEVQNTKKDISDYWRESAERRYSGAHSGIKKLGDTLQSAGAMAVALMTGGGSAVADYTAKGFKAAANTADAVRAGMNAEKYAEAWQAARDMARYAKNGAKAFFEPSSALFGMSAAGSSTEDAYRRSGDMGRSLAYGTMSGIGEMATEKIFGGFAGTDVGESVIDFNIKNPYVRKTVNTATEALEEQIMTGLDPIMLRASGVDRNAELATLGEYAESGLGGVTLSAIMNAAMLPIKKVGRANSVKILNEASEEINKYAANDNDIMKPLSKFASDSEIQKRQEELTYYTKNLVNKIQNKEKQASQQEGQRGAENKQGAKSENPPSDISETGKGEDISGYDEKGTVRSGKNKVVSQWGKNIGENGRKAYKDNIREDTDIAGYTRGFVRYYDLGLAGVPFDTVKTEMEGHIYGKYLTPDQGYAAYYSGVNDAKLSLENEKNKVKTVDYFSDDAGIVDNEHLTGLDEKFVKATDKLVRGLGVQAVFTDEIEGGKLNGFMDERGKMVLSRDSSMTYASLAGHEITHRIQQLSPEEYRTYRDYVINEVGADRVDEYRTKLNEAGYYIGEEQLLDEIAADFTGEKLLKDTESISDFVRDVNQKTGNLNIVQRLHKAICDFLTKVKSIFKGDKKAQDSAANEAFGTDTATLEKARDLLKKAYDNGVKEIERRKGQEKAQDIDLGDGVKYSVKETFAKQVDDTLNKNVDDRNHVYVSETTDIMKKIGFNDKPMLMTRGHLRDMHHEKVKGITKYHGMSEKTINKLPEILKHPAMIFDSLSDKNSDAVCMLSEITDSDGLPILVAIKPDGQGRYNNVTIESNFILSAYGKNGAQWFMDKLAQNKDKIIFADKERTQEMLKAARLYLPAELSNLEFDTIIHQSENIVNSQNVSNSKNVRNRDGVKYSVKHTTDNRPVAVVDEDILKGVPKSEWVKTAKEKIKKFRPGIQIDDKFISVNRKTSKEYTNSGYTQSLKKKDPGKYSDKLRASGNLNDVVQATESYVNENLKHERKDNFVQFERGYVLMQIGGNKYKADVVVGVTLNNDRVLYDVVGIDETDFELKKSDELNGRLEIPKKDKQDAARLSSDTNNISQSESVVNSQNVSNSKNSQNRDGVKYSVKHTTDNRPVAVVDEDILDGTKKSDWIKSAKEAMKKFSPGIPIGGRLVKVNKITRDEYTNSKYTQKISQVDTSVYKDKLNASGSLDEIILASDNYVNEDLKHKRKDSFIQFARGDVLLQSSKNKYKAKVVIGITANNEMVLYDVIDFDRTDFDIKKSDKLDGYFDEQKPIRLNLPDNNNISQSESVVNSQYTQNGEKNAQNTRKFSVKTESENVKNGDTITIEDVNAVQSIPRKSVNDFNAEDIKKTERFARRYFKEMGTKSPFFRSWFGDWREKDTTKVKVATEKGAQRGVTKNIDTGWEINVSGKVFDETGHKGLKNQKALPYLDYINSIVENAVLLDSHTISSEKAKSANSAMMHSLYAIADMGNGKELLKLYVEELNDVNSDGTIKRAYQLQNIISQQLKSSEFGTDPSSIISTADVDTISDLFKLVKAFDKNFSPKGEGKVVNADGTPKVVYHGTDKNFTVFDITKSRSYDETLNYDLPGFYFSESTDESGSYGGNLSAYYIDIKNPYTGDVYSLQKEKGSFRKAYDYLVKTGYDGVIVDEFGDGFYEYIVFSPEQIKSAENNIGTFDKSNPDVRFSVKGTENILGDAEKLRQLEGRLAQEYLNLKGEAGKSISKAEFGKAAKSILDELGLAYKKEQLAAEMENLAKDTRNIMRGDASGVSKQTQEAMRGEMDFETFRGKVKEIAENIIDSESVRDSEAYASTSELREYLRTTPIKVDSETRANLGEEYESIRKKNFGRLRLNQKEGLDIGTAYSELELLFPEFFNTATETNGTEQLRNISDVIEQVKALNDNPYNGYRDEAVEWLSNMLIDKIYDVGIKTGGNSVRITADMNELRNNAAEAFQRAADADRKWRDREYDKMRRGFEEKFKQKNIALNKKYEKMSDGLKEKDKRRTEYRDKLVKMKQIRLHTERISKMLVSPSDKTAVPEFLRKPVADFLSCIDLKNDRMGEKTTVRLNELQKLYQHISDGDIDANLIVDPDLANNIETIVTETEALGTKDKALTSLSNETLETMRQAAMAIERSVSTYNKAFREGKGQQIYQLGESVAADMRKRKDYKGSKNGILQANADLLNMDMLNPWDFFHMLGPTAEGLYGELRAGMNKQTEYLNKAKEQMNTLREKFGVDADVSKVITEYKTENGDTIPLSKAQVMSLYCLIRRSAAREHILLGGIRPDGVDKGVVYDENGKRKSQAKRAAKERRVSVTAEDVRRITDSLSENEKEFAKGISDYFSSVCAEQGNEVSLQLYGYKKYSTQNYFPIVSDDSFIKKEHGAARDARLKNKSFSKNTVMHANNPIIVRDIFDVYAQHTSDMASYSAFVLPIQDMERVFNVKGLETGESVRELLEQKFGRRAGAYFDNFMEDINGGAKYEDGNKLINKAISNYKSAKIGANLRVAVQQPMSYIRAAAVMDSKYLAEAFAPGSARKVDLDTVYKYAPIARWKDWGFFSMDTGKDMKGLLLDKKQLSDYTMALAGKLDQVTWKRIWRAVELETAEKHSELAKGSEEFYQECGKRFDEIIDRTQVVDSTLHRSQALRSKDGLVKVSTSFMSEPLKTYNLLRTAAADYKANPSKQTRATFIRTGAVCLISSVANAVVTGAYDTLKGDEDENFWENAVSNFVGDWTGMVPVYKDIFSVIEGFTPKRMELQGIGDFVASFKRACSDKYTKAFVVSDLIMRFADLCGIPATSLKTSVYDLIIKNIFRRIDNQWLDYNLTKQMYRVANPDNKSKFTDVLFEAWQKGHKEQYDKIVADMIDNGIDAKTINTRLKTKYKKFTETAEPGTIKGFDVPWDNKSEIPTQKTEDKFGLENLNSKQYAKYEKEAVSLEREVVGTVENYKGEFNSQDYNSMLSAAYDYVTETALESASGGEYETGSNWIANAQEAAEYGLEPAEYIKYKQEYGARALAIDKLRDIMDMGIDVETYLEFDRFTAGAHADKDKNGKSIAGSKKKKVVEWLDNADIDEEEWNYFFYDVMGYKKR